MKNKNANGSLVNENAVNETVMVYKTGDCDLIVLNNCVTWIFYGTQFHHVHSLVTSFSVVSAQSLSELATATDYAIVNKDGIYLFLVDPSCQMFLFRDRSHHHAVTRRQASFAGLERANASVRTNTLCRDRCASSGQWNANVFVWVCPITQPSL